MNPLTIIGKGEGWEEALRNPGDKWSILSVLLNRPTAGINKAFEIHGPSVWNPRISEFKDRVVIAWDKPGFEQCERLPVVQLFDEFGPIFASSISWMLGYALTSGYRDITIAGVDMSHQTEYGEQRDYFMYLVGVAIGRGVQVTIPEKNQTHLWPKMYGIGWGK